MSLQRVAMLSGCLLHGATANILSLVDPLIGTTNGGHVFPGATLPFGMAKAGADVNVENQGMCQLEENLFMRPRRILDHSTRHTAK